MTMNEESYNGDVDQGGSYNNYPHNSDSASHGYFYNDGDCSSYRYHVDHDDGYDRNAYCQWDMHDASTSIDDHHGYNNSLGDSTSFTDTMGATSIFVPTRPPLVVHTSAQSSPDSYGNYDAQYGDPISALARESHYSSSPLLHVASHTANVGTSDKSARRLSLPQNQRGGAEKLCWNSFYRGSRMTVLWEEEHDAHSHQDNGRFQSRHVYSTFVAHPEADCTILDALHSVLFSNGTLYSAIDEHPDNRNNHNYNQNCYNRQLSLGTNVPMKPRPANSYGPPFGPSFLVSNTNSSLYGDGMSTASMLYNLHGSRIEEKHCMGISSILPLPPTPFYEKSDRVCSISPYGVRIHSRGGFLFAEKREQLSGMVCGVLLSAQGDGSQFATVGGMPFSPAKSKENAAVVSSRQSNVHCLDLQRDMTIVSSHTLMHDSIGSSVCGKAENEPQIAVSDMVLNRDRNNIVVGCTDGTIRVLDGKRRQVEVAKAKAHKGGVAQVAAYENLICATGYSSSGVSSATSPVPYPFPAQHVLIYDIRYLGRGGVPHMSTTRSGPRFAAFLPNDSLPGLYSGADPLLLVGSGQTYGGFELISPFQTHCLTNFFQPELTPGESMTTVFFDHGELIIGTSYGRVLQYGLASYQKTTHSPKFSTGSVIGTVSSNDMSRSVQSFDVTERIHRETLEIPPFVPLPPEISIDPTILCSSYQSNGHITQGWNVFDSYMMATDPIISEENSSFPQNSSFRTVNTTTLGPLSSKTLIKPSKRWLSTKLQAKLNEDNFRSGPSEGFVKVIDANSLDISDLMAQHSAANTSSDQLRKTDTHCQAENDGLLLSNPNKFLYSVSLYSACYNTDAGIRKKAVAETESKEITDDQDLSKDEDSTIPQRYKVMVRPQFYKVTNFDYNLYNETGVWLGWDYALCWANSWACPILTLLYFIEEIRSVALEYQLHDDRPLLISGKYSRRFVSAISELGLLFNLIEEISVNSAIYPDGMIRAFVPSNFISAFTLVPEALNLALLDGVGGSTEVARRPEAFYRFLMQYLCKELMQLSLTQKTAIDALQSINFFSMIEYSNAKPKLSTSRALTVDLTYDPKWGYKKGEPAIRFSEVLRFSLCRETPLRAYCDESRSYEAVIQRKIATSLPPLLSLSCCCAGTSDTYGLQFWNSMDVNSWLPEFVVVRIEENRSISVRELTLNSDGMEEWITASGELSVPDLAMESLGEDSPQNFPIEKSYSLQAVISFIRSSSNEASESKRIALNEGHHIVHIRAPSESAKEFLLKQLDRVEESISEKNNDLQQQQLTLMSNVLLSTLKDRRINIQEKLLKSEDTKNSTSEDDWLLINGFVVTKTSSIDARSFNNDWKEPCIVIYREIIETASDKDIKTCDYKGPLVPSHVMDTVTLSNVYCPSYSANSVSDLPGKGDLIAIDCEFVSVQAEESHITSSGSKEITSESRNALARISIIDCKTNEVIVDDYVLPSEPITDYLTRFSGIREIDLDPDHSPHHLITTREAYLKVRLLMERGCLFVGHGLNQDFRIINISVPSNQIIDTAEIYHQPKQRYISLRYLANYVLERDLQQDVHDSIEDARAALELYVKASTLKIEGKLDEFIVQLYAHGHRTQFRLGFLD